MNPIILDTTELKKAIAFDPTPSQREILSELKRINVIVGGRRCGKSYLISYLALREILLPNREVWIVSPIYNLAKIIFNNLSYWTNRNFQQIFKINISEMTITNNFNSSKLTLKSADNLASLKGQGLDLLIIDEAGMIDEEVFVRYLRANISESRPALKGEKGRLIVAGNASSQGSWFHKLYQEESPDQFSYYWPIAREDRLTGEILATNNPLVEVEELKNIKKSTPNFIWKSEYMAEWLSPEASLFKNIKENIREIRKVPQQDRFYSIGVDLARKADFSVITVMDSATFELVHFDRFQNTEWAFQKAKIIEIAKIFKGKVFIDSTGLGDVILDDLFRAGLNVEGYTFTNESKKQILEKLAIYIETGRIGYPDISELIKELSIFGYQVSPKTGRLIYSAPSGYHDDCVISLALACWGLPEFPLIRNDLPKDPQVIVKLGAKEKWNQILSKEPRRERKEIEFNM